MADQNQKCLGCLVSVAIANEDEHTQQTPTRLTPRPLKYVQFEVEMAVDGFPFELGAGAMAVTYRARDTVLNSHVALKVIDRYRARREAVRQLGTPITRSAVSDLRSNKATFGADNLNNRKG